MLQPYINSKQKSQIKVVNFDGLDRQLSATANKISDEYNITDHYYPALAPRERRKMIKRIDNMVCVSSAGYGCYVNDVGIDRYFTYVDETGAEITTKLYAPGKINQIIKSNQYYLFFPQKIAFDTSDLSIIDLKNSVQDTFEIKLISDDDTELQNLTIAATAPESPAEGDTWIDTTDTNNITLKRYSTIYTGWFEFTGHLTIISSANSKAAFRSIGIKASDKMQISATLNNGDIVIDDNYYEILYADDDSIKIACNPLIYAAGTNNVMLKISRNVPDMDFVTEYNNRLWGYSNEKNEIYSSELGNPLSWNYFGTDATASYALKCGTNGDFTGIAAYSGYLLFFKRDCVHKLYGSYPPYQITTDSLSGIAPNAASSAVAINGTLYYIGCDGVYAYSGAYPVNISSPLGNIKYDGGVACADGYKYYVSIFDNTQDQSCNYVFNTKTSTWSCEDNHFGYESVVKYNSRPAIFTEKTLTYLHDEEADEILSNWSITTAEIYDDMFEHTTISKIIIKLVPITDCDIKVYLQTDKKSFELLKSAHYKTNTVIRLPVIPRRCRTMKIKIEGCGDCRICGYNIEYSKGSDR